MLAAIFSLVSSIVSGLAKPVSDVFINRSNTQGAEFAAMTQAQQAEVLGALQAQTALNQSKVANNSSTVSHLMVLAFGLPPAIYLGAFYISAAIPWLGWHVDPLRGDAGKEMMDIAKTIALSFFIYGGIQLIGGPLIGGLASRLRG